MEGSCLVDAREYGELGAVRNYPAFRETGLFRRFASTEATKEGVRGFANEYGLLGGEVAVSVQLPTEQKPNEYHFGSGETLYAWGAEISAMRHTIELWEAARAGAATRLSEFIRWQRKSAKGDDAWPHTRVSYIGPRSKFEKHATTFIIASETTNAETLSRFQPGDVVHPAKRRQRPRSRRPSERPWNSGPRSWRERRHKSRCAVPNLGVRAGRRRLAPWRRIEAGGRADDNQDLT